MRTVGFCFQHAGSQYDSNMDGVPDAPFPRCTSLTTGDVLPPVAVPVGNEALDFFCLPWPMRKQAEPFARRVIAPVIAPMLSGWR